MGAAGDRNFSAGRRGRETPPYNDLPLTAALATQIAERFRVAIDPSVWADKPLPDHLRVRVRVLDAKGKELCASRELAEIDEALHLQKRAASATVARVEPEAWRRARAKWETPAQTTWKFGDISERVLVTEQAGVPVFAFPALQAEQGGVALRLAKTPEEAEQLTRRGLAALIERQISNDLGWLERDLRAVRNLGPLISTLAPADELQAQAFAMLRGWLCDPDRCRAGSPDPAAAGALSGERRGRETPPYNLNAAAFAAALAKSKEDLRGLVSRFCDQLREILTLRQALMVQSQAHAGLERDLVALLPSDFLRTTPYAQLPHFPRYLKAMKLRAERWRQNPAKDAERAAQLAPYVAAAEKLRDREGGEALRWLVEEFRVSLFAQELGTAEPVSLVKLDRALVALQHGIFAAGAGSREALPSPTVVKPIVAAVVSEKKGAALKSLNALDKLFGR